MKDLHDRQNDVVSCILLEKQIAIYDDVDHDFQIGFFLVIDFLIENSTKKSFLDVDSKYRVLQEICVLYLPWIFGVFEVSRLMIQIVFFFCYGYLTGIYYGTFLLSLAFLIYKVSLGNGSLVFGLQYLTSSLRYLIKRGFILLRLQKLLNLQKLLDLQKNLRNFR